MPPGISTLLTRHQHVLVGLRPLASARLRQWVEAETVTEARDGLLDMARRCERLASELEAVGRGSHARQT